MDAESFAASLASLSAVIIISDVLDRIGCGHAGTAADRLVWPSRIELSPADPPPGFCRSARWPVSVCCVFACSPGFGGPVWRFTYAASPNCPMAYTYSSADGNPCRRTMSLTGQRYWGSILKHGLWPIVPDIMRARAPVRRRNSDRPAGRRRVPLLAVGKPGRRQSRSSNQE
jgi:hypothetical protein